MPASVILNLTQPPDGVIRSQSMSENSRGRSSAAQRHKSLIERLTAFIFREPENREQLLELLSEAHERDLLDADALVLFRCANHAVLVPARMFVDNAARKAFVATCTARVKAAAEGAQPQRSSPPGLTRWSMLT